MESILQQQEDYTLLMKTKTTSTDISIETANKVE